MTEPAGARGYPAAVLKLRPLLPADEEPFRAGHAQLAAEGVIFGLRLERGTRWDEYLRLISDQRAGLNLPDGQVPSTFLVAEAAGEIVGRVSIRHHLNEFLRRYGGHIGYAVLPAHRRRGHATEILRQSLIIARSLGIDRVLMTCDDDNAGSIAVIESCGGRLTAVAPGDPGRAETRHYWID